MKRSMDLCREILLNLEAQPFGSGVIEVKIRDNTELEVSYHLMLLDQAGLVEAENLSKSTQKMRWRARYITWAGHEFLEASRNQTIWDRAKATMAEKSVGMSFDIVKTILIKYGTEALIGK